MQLAKNNQKEYTAPTAARLKPNQLTILVVIALTNLYLLFSDWYHRKRKVNNKPRIIFWGNTKLKQIDFAANMHH